MIEKRRKYESKIHLELKDKIEPTELKKLVKKEKKNDHNKSFELSYHSPTLTEEVFQILTKLKDEKCPGPHKINNKIQKFFAN